MINSPAPSRPLPAVPQERRPSRHVLRVVPCFARFLGVPKNAPKKSPVGVALSGCAAQRAVCALIAAAETVV